MGYGMQAPFANASLQDFLAQRRLRQLQEEAIARQTAQQSFENKRVTSQDELAKQLLARKLGIENIGLMQGQEPDAQTLDRVPGAAGAPAIPGISSDSLGQIRLSPAQFAPQEVPGVQAAGVPSVKLRPRTGTELSRQAEDEASQKRTADLSDYETKKAIDAMYAEKGITPYQQAQLDLSRDRFNETRRHNSALEQDGINADSPDAMAAANAMGEYMAVTGRLPIGFRIYGRDSAPIYIQIAKRAKEFAEENGLSLAGSAAAFTANQASLTQMQKIYDAAQSFLRTADKNAQLLAGLLAKVPDTGSPIFNLPLRAFATQVSGDPTMAQFNTYLRSIQNEYAKILTNPNLTGQLTDTARKEAATLLDPKANVKQILAAIQALQTEGDNRLVSISDQINSIIGRITEQGAPQQGETGRVYYDADGNPIRR